MLKKRNQPFPDVLLLIRPSISFRLSVVDSHSMPTMPTMPTDCSGRELDISSSLKSSIQPECLDQISSVGDSLLY